MIYNCRRTLFRCALLAFAVMLSGCASIVHKPQLSATPGRQKIAIFFDGTHNDIASDTNIKRLHSLVSLQRENNISSLYLEGVGVGIDPLGAGAGVGMEARIRIAYEFVLNHYRAKDQIYIFGFSRGAYAARILASMLYNVGLVTQGDPGGKRPMTATEIANGAFDAYKQPLREDDEKARRVEATKALALHGLTPSNPVNVEVLGLWDTVEAMGVPDWGSRILHDLEIRQHVADIDVRNNRYGDQLCNVKRAYQALSIDDDREWIFTPLPLDRTHLFRHCVKGHTPMLDEDGKIRPGVLREVWFAGAHSDVGGGYADSLLSGVSLNWMIDNLTGRTKDGKNESDAGLLPHHAGVRSDPFGTSHDAEGGIWRVLYHNMKRDLGTYVMDQRVEGSDQPYPRRRAELGHTLCVHSSVLQRRAALPLQPWENNLLALQKAGPVHLVAEFKKGRPDWLPRLREARTTVEVKRSTLLMQVEQWPNCRTMQ